MFYITLPLLEAMVKWLCAGTICVCRASSDTTMDVVLLTAAKVHLLASPCFFCSSQLCSVSMAGQTEHVEFLVFALKVAPNSFGALGGPALAVSAHFLS